jgi:hypothetical protein
MDMNTLLRARTLSLEDITTENFSPDMSNDESSSIQSEEVFNIKKFHYINLSVLESEIKTNP